MKTFHISDLLAATTGRLVSINGLAGVYTILDYLTGDRLYTHQVPRAIMSVSESALHDQFPELFPDHPKMTDALAMLDASLAGVREENRKQVCFDWVEDVRVSFGLPEYVMIVSPMAAVNHKHIDPVEELARMTGKKPIVIQVDP